MGENAYESTAELTDENYFSLYFTGISKWKYNVNADKHYFQTKEITSFLLNYLRSYPAVYRYVYNNPFNDRYGNNNDIYIHVRLGDMINANVGAQYYLSVIKSIPHANIYLSTDTIDHQVIYDICTAYPDVNVMLFDEVNTILFASTCKHIILSHGTFSAVIGYLSHYSTVHYPVYKKLWHGDIFSVDGWIKHEYDVVDAEHREIVD